jgi:hypothetical protein
MAKPITVGDFLDLLEIETLRMHRRRDRAAHFREMNAPPFMRCRNARGLWTAANRCFRLSRRIERMRSAAWSAENN